MLRTPNAERAPNPRIDTRVSCDGLFRLATVTPGSSARVCSTSVCVCPGATLSGRTLLIAYGRSSDDRPTSRVTVTTGGKRRATVSCADSVAAVAVEIRIARKGAVRRTTVRDGGRRQNLLHGMRSEERRV